MATTATARRAHRPRTVAPKATTPAEVPATKPSIWTRIKTAAKKTAAVVVKPFKAVAAKIKPATKRVAAVAKKVVAKAAPFAKKFWHLALKPLLVGVVGGLALFGLIVGAIVAPFTTAFCLIATALLSFLLARVVQGLEETENMSRFARVTLRVLDIVARIGAALVYAASALVVLALCASSWTFSLFVVAFLTLAYLQVRGAGSIAFIAWAVVSGHWSLALLWTLFVVARIPARAADVAVPEYSEIRRKAETHETVRRAPRDYVDHDGVVTHETANSDVFNAQRPAGSFLRAKGTEELWGTEWDKAPEAEDVDPNWADVWVNDKACDACGTTDGAMRARSHKRPTDKQPEAWLCSACYDHECEDNALKFTGVSLKARSVEVHLNQAGIEASKEFEVSKAQPDENVWLDAVWWRDRDGNEHLRERALLRDGVEVARIRKNHKRGSFLAVVLGRVVGGPKKTAVEAQALAQDELDREQAVVRRYEEAAAEIAGEAPARQAKKA